MSARVTNPFAVAPLVRWVAAALCLCAYGLVFVHVKNEQHRLGEGLRQVERQLADERSLNEVLLARITTLSSRAELQRRLQEGFIALRPIPQSSLAVLAPASEGMVAGLVQAGAPEARVP